MISTSSTTILLVEDDATISEMLAYSLKRAGYEVIQQRDGRSGLDAALSYKLDLVILDLMLPELDGYSVSKEIARRKPHLPIIMLTARKDTKDVLDGFNAGADDYITKPFNIDELLVRIEVRLRRKNNATDRLNSSKENHVSLDDVILDSNARMLRTPHGESELNGKEHDLLELLMSQPGHLFKREELMQSVWHQQYILGSRTLDVHVRHLREKLAEVHAPISIETKRGIGYRLVSR